MTVDYHNYVVTLLLQVTSIKVCGYGVLSLLQDCREFE